MQVLTWPARWHNDLTLFTWYRRNISNCHQLEREQFMTSYDSLLTGGLADEMPFVSAWEKWCTWLWNWPKICQLWRVHFPKAPASKQNRRLSKWPLSQEKEEWKWGERLSVVSSPFKLWNHLAVKQISVFLRMTSLLLLALLDSFTLENQEDFGREVVKCNDKDKSTPERSCTRVHSLQEPYKPIY